MTRLPRRFWQDMTTEEFARLDRERVIALLPVGAIEQHGPHLPVCVDACINQGIVASALELLPDDLPVTVLPMLPIGKSDEHLAFPGTLTLSAETVIRLWTEVGDGIHVRRHRSLDLNIGAVICPGGILLIDTRASHRQARDLLRSLERFRLPVRWVINTHHHWDHTFGNGVFGDSAIWGHERCAVALRDNGEDMRRSVVAMAPDHADDLDEVVITPPSFTFSFESTVSFGGRDVTLRHLGRGHTDNDAAVFVDGVVFAGDLIEEGAPPSFSDAFPLEWPDTASALAAVSGGVVVPGHGAVVDAAFINTQQAELSEVATLARERHDEGLTPAEAAAQGGPYPEGVLATAFARAWPQLEAP